MPQPDIPTTKGTMTVVDEDEILSGDGLRLILARHSRGGSKQSQTTVLLLHGASAASTAFQIPRSRSLIDFLLDKDADVWTLDWRGSHRVSPKHKGNPEKFTLDAAAEQDLPAAVAAIRDRKPGVKQLAMFGHCMGAGTLAMTIGAGFIKAGDISHAVLSTLGLFYQVPWDSWVKAEDHTLERIRSDQPEVNSVDADADRKPWPDLMERAYKRWPKTLLPPAGNEIFRRLSFMFGRPYRSDVVPDDVHNEEALRVQFGEIPFRLYMHCAQNVRRGFAAPFDHTVWRQGADKVYLNADKFQDITLTLITGSRNELWHPDAMHQMYDWLNRRPGPAACTRRIFSGYAHQDLLWAKAAREEVYPTIAAGLGLS